MRSEMRERSSRSRAISRTFTAALRAAFSPSRTRMMRRKEAAVMSWPLVTAC